MANSTSVQSRRGGPRQKRWSHIEARGLLAAHELSGLSLAAFARQKGVSPPRLMWWRSRLRHTSPRASLAVRLLPVTIKDGAEGPSQGRLEIVLRGGHVIRVIGGVDPEVLAQAVQVLEGPGC